MSAIESGLVKPSYTLVALSQNLRSEHLLHRRTSKTYQGLEVHKALKRHKELEAPMFLEVRKTREVLENPLQITDPL